MPQRVPIHRPAHLPATSTGKERTDYRASAGRRGYGRKWRKESKAFLSRAANRVCQECKRRGRVELATVVDHIRPHRGDRGAFWEQANWQGLCKPCHDRKTGRGA